MQEDFSFYNLPRMKSQKTRVVKKRNQSEIESYRLTVINDVRHTEGLDFEISVPKFANWQLTTYAKAGSYWYTVEDARENTRYSGQVTFSLSYDPFLTFTSMTFPSVKALWKKLPYAYPYAKRGTVLDDSNMKESRKEALSVMSLNVAAPGYTPQYKDMVWVEVTTTCQLRGRVDVTTQPLNPKITDAVDLETFIEHSVKDQSKLYKYGFFALYDKGNGVRHIKVCDYSFNGMPLEYHYKSGGTEQTATISEYIAHYPTINDVINDPDSVLGIPADAIMDVSVSAWCPYVYSIRTIDSELSWPNNSLVPFLVDASDNVLYPYIMRKTKVYNPEEIYGGQTYYDDNWICMYNLGQLGGSLIARDNWGSHMMEITEDEYVCGEINLRDANGNVIANIPRDYFVYDPPSDKYRLYYKAQTYSDSTGLYTRVDIGSEGIPHIITFPEGKLPYIGDTYEQYRIREMSYDRQALENTKDQAWMEFGVGVAESLVGGGMTMAMGRVGAASSRTEAGRNAATGMAIGGGIISSAINTALSIQAAEKEQELTEARQKGAPGTGYNTGYGISYCDNAFDIGAGFVVMMPAKFYRPEAHEQGRYYGYEAGFVGDISITDEDGYYEGVPQMMTGSYQLPDYLYNRFAELLMNGVRIIRV